MANEIGTATNFEDFFSKIVAFLTTNATLVAAGQAWQTLRVRRDNIDTFTTSLPDYTFTSAGRKQIHTFRYDPRSLNTNNPASDDQQSFWYTSDFSAGNSYGQWKLRQAREVKTVRIKAPTGSSFASFAPESFRLQYSDNGTAWTTALTVSNAPNWSVGERRDFAVPGTPDSELFPDIFL